MNLPVLSNITIASPCDMKWEDMTGTDRVRKCARCNINVYNFTNMSAADSQSLIETTEGRICAGFFRRTDGSIITRDCPVGFAAARAAVIRVTCRIAALVATVAAAVVIGRTREAFAEPLSLTSRRPFSTFADLLGVPAPQRRFYLGRITAPSSQISSDSTSSQSTSANGALP